ncbi:MAG: PglZ domain-containing protein [Planctomycetes bacterium]|nr:PglZ domain-containing protein [Planctomycetota bacterium]
MPTQPTPVANDLVEYCTAVLQPLFDEKRAVVWYDREGVLEEVLRATAGQHGWHMVPGPGARNPLAARAAIEELIHADGCQWLAERKCLVYVAAARRQPSWYEDLELAGRAVQKTLAELIAERHNLPTPRVAALINARASKRLVAQWEQLFPNGTWLLDLEKLGAALLALAFGESSLLTPQNAVVRFLRDPAALNQALLAEGLMGTFVHVIRTQLGFGRLPEADAVKPALLVRAMMASELIHKGACDTGHALHNYLPQKNHLPAWAALAESVIKDADCRDSFRQLATEVEAEAHLVQHATNLRALTTVASLPSVDDRLLEEAIARCQAAPAGSAGVWSELRDWADERLKLERWGAVIASDWEVVGRAARLLLRCQAAEEDLNSLPGNVEPDALIRRYSDHDSGWWQLDDLHRGLELRFADCRAGVVEHLGKPAVAALWKWCRRLALAFADAFERAGSYMPANPDVLPHGRFWSELVETGDLGETAVLLVDALRIDLAENLIARLQQQGRQVSSRLALASLPSKTPVGMASLLPRGGSPLVVLVKNGKLRSEIDGLDVSDPDGRKDQLQRHISNVAVAELKKIPELQLKQ